MGYICGTTVVGDTRTWGERRKSLLGTRGEVVVCELGMSWSGVGELTSDLHLLATCKLSELLC